MPLRRTAQTERKKSFGGSQLKSTYCLSLPYAPICKKGIRLCLGQLDTPTTEMSSLKRKDAPGGKEGPSKRPKGEKSPASKGEAKGTTKSPKAASNASPAVPIISKLKEEEPLFPRGGGSVLSPLEHKQIQVQAKHDALFEQETETPSKAEKGQKKKKRKSTSKDGKGLDKLLRDEDAVKIESLNYKVRN